MLSESTLSESCMVFRIVRSLNSSPLINVNLSNVCSSLHRSCFVPDQLITCGPEDPLDVP